MCKFISKAAKKVERLSNKILKPVGINSNFFAGKLGKGAVDAGVISEVPSDIENLAEEAAKELEDEKSKATEDTIQQTSAKRFRSGARGRRSLLRSKSGGGAGFYNRFQL